MTEKCKLFYHISSRLYKIDDQITPSNYQAELDDKRMAIENNLEEYRALNYPSKPSRANAVFAFKQLSDAYYYLKQHGGYLYVVSLDINKLIACDGAHIGDMGIIELLHTISKMDADDLYNRLIAQYWAGETLFQPCYEILIDQLVVKDILINEKRDTVLETTCLHKSLVEYDTEYIQLLNRTLNTNNENIIKLKTMKSQMQIFREQGVEFQKALTNMALYMCYLSSRYSSPFCVQYIIDEHDDYRYDYLDGFLHGICLAQDSPIVCSRYIMVTGIGKPIDWYLCKSFNFDINSITKSLEENHIKKLEENIQSIQSQLHANNFSYVNGININQTSLNDDICLYALLYASNNHVTCMPMKVLEDTTPCYHIVEALGFIEGLHIALKDNFDCTLDSEGNIITINNINKEYFTRYDRVNLINKYANQYMHIEGILDYIESIVKNLIV